jgi:citrate synthase
MTIPGIHDRSGLDGIVAATTALSHVDGQKGELIIGGNQVGHLALTESFDAVAARLWRIARRSDWPEMPGLGPSRAALFSSLARPLAAASGLSAIDGLRAAIASLAIQDGPDAAVQVSAAVGTLVPALHRQSLGLPPVEPDPSLGHAADILRMMRGRPATAAEARALDTYLVTVCDHGMNASTFAARVVIATQASLVSAITGAYGALTGPLHGGAPGPVLDMLDDIGGEQAIGPWLEDALANGKRIMGFGHRIYRTRDPRADVLKEALNRLAPNTEKLRLASALERQALLTLAARRPDRRLDINVEFYTALLLDALAIRRSLFTPVFAAGRVAGWTAHAIEHHARGGRLIRPDSVYDGPRPPLTPPAALADRA